MARMSLQATFDQARQWLESNDLDRAIGLSEHILQSYPNNLEAHRLLGEARLANRQLDQAQESFEYILSADPENIPAHVGLGVTLERRGKLEQAVREFEQALEIKPDMPELRSQVLRLYTEGGIENPQLRLSHAGLARLYAKGQMLPQAVNEFRKVIKTQPDRYDTRVALAETLWNNEQEEEAAALSQALLSEKPNLVKPHLLLGYMKLASGEHTGAQHWQSAADFDPYMSIAQSIFEVLPDMEQPELDIESWDEGAWRKRRAEEQEQIAATRPMEVAQTPTQNEFVPGAGFFTQPEPVPNFNPIESDDFLASLLSLESAPVDAALAPGSAPAQPHASIAATTPVVSQPQEPVPTSATTSSDDDLDIASMQPFSLSDLGLSDDELAGLDSLESVETHSPVAQEPTTEVEPATTSPGNEFARFQDDFATLDSLDSFDDHPSVAPTATSPQVESIQPTQQNEDELDLAHVRPFSFSELGLDDDEIASLQSLETLDDQAAVDVNFPLLTEEDDDLGDLSADLHPFSIDEIEQHGSIPGDLDELPAALQPFSLDDVANVGRPRVSGLTPDIGLDEINVEDDNEAGKRGFSWQQPSLKPEPDFVSSLRETDPPPGSSLFDKLQQQRQQNPPAQASAPISDTMSIDENEDMGLFSLDNERLYDDVVETPKDSPLTGIAQREGTARTPVEPASTAPIQPVAPTSTSTSSQAFTEEGDLQGAIVAGEIQPFSLADLGLSDEEIAALGISAQPNTSIPGEVPIGAAEPIISEQPEISADVEALSERDTAEDQDEEFFNIDSLDFSEDDLPDFDFGTPEPPISSPTSIQAHAEPVEIDNLEDALDSGLIQPFSFADLGLTDEEIALLNAEGAAEPAATAAAQADVEIPTESFSLDDLDLSTDELPSLDLGETLHANTNTPDTSSTESFNIDDLGLSTDELPSLDLGEPAVQAESPEFELPSLDLSEPEAPQTIHEQTEKFMPEGDIDTLEEALDAGMVKPFSLADLGLSDEEIALLNLGEEPATLDIEEPTQPRSDTIHALSEPEQAAVGEASTEAAESAEDLPSLAEFLNLGELSDEHAELELSDAKVAELKAEQSSEDFDFGFEDDIQPFSLGDLGSIDTASSLTQPDSKLGLSHQELATFSLPKQSDIQDNIPNADSSGDIAADRLLALGRERGYIDISDIIAAVSNPEEESDRIEMIGQLLHQNNIEIRDGDEVIDMDAEYEEEELLEANPMLTSTSEEPDMTPFSLAELGLSDDEIALLGLEEETELGEPALAFDIDKQDQQQEPVTEPLEPLATISDLDIVEAESANVTPEPLAFETGQPFSLSDLDIVEEQPEPIRAPSTEKAAMIEDKPATTVDTPLDSSATDRSFQLLEQYLKRVEQEPENHPLRLSVARAGIRLGNIEVGVRNYKQLIRHNMLLDDIADDLKDMITENDDVHVLRQLHRTLGDLFSAQGKLVEAMQLYSWTADQPKYSE